MSNVQYTQLIDLLNANPNNIETIKEQYLLLLSELTSTSYLETDLFIENVKSISRMGAIIVGIITDISNNIEIISSGTIIVEPKILRGGKSVGHIEDIVVANHMRGKGLSQKLLEILKFVARENNCYKVILNCNKTIKNVYIKNGFSIKGIEMAEYFN